MFHFGLKAKDIENMHSIFARHESVEKVIIYGSRAKGNYKPYSDIDLAIVGKNIDEYVQQKIENELDDLLLPNKFDISMYNKILNKDLLEHIDISGKIVYSRI